MDQELKDLKSVLRSLVVSSPTQMDVRSLLRDYRNMVGSPVPILKYGYRDPMQFLKERCNDCFMFQGPAANPVLTLIVPETLKHIDKFVQKQKVSTKVKLKGKRRSIPEQVMKQKDLIVNTYVPRSQYSTETQPKPVEANRNSYYKPVDISRVTNQKQADVNTVRNPVHISNNTSQKPVEICNYKESDTEKKTSFMNSKTYSNLNIHHDEAKVRTEAMELNKENKHSNTNDQTENYSPNAVQNFLKKRMPIYNSSCNVDSEKSYDGKVSSKDDDDSGRQTSSSNSSTKAALLEELKIEIRDLIADYPEGVWCTDLISLYRERYKRELNFSRFGYTSIISLVCMLEDAVRISRPVDTGNWLLSDARAAAREPRPRRYLPVSVARCAPAAALPVDVDDALPGIDFDPDVFPADCVHFMESIPSASLGELCPGAMLEVMVGEVYSPSHFWLLRLGEAYNIAMEDIMDEMTQYYTYGEGKDRSLALGAVRVGQYCSSVYERDWHRSLIVRIVDSDTVKVRHVDYGTVEAVRVAALKPLRREWARLPAQALRARLAGVRPPAAGRRWPHAASSHFLAAVRDTRLVANVVCVDREEDILEVFLINTSTEEDVCVSAEMIRAGHADARGDSALHVSSPSPSPSGTDVRTLLAAIQHMGNPEESGNLDDASEVSASASEVVGRQPRRLKTWDGESDRANRGSEADRSSEADRGSVANGVPDDASTVSYSSVRLARLCALYSRLRAPSELSAAPPPSPPLQQTAEVPPVASTSTSSGSSSSETGSVISITSHLLRRRLALAEMLAGRRSAESPPAGPSPPPPAGGRAPSETASVTFSSLLLQRRLELSEK